MSFFVFVTYALSVGLQERLGLICLTEEVELPTNVVVVFKTSFKLSMIFSLMDLCVCWLMWRIHCVVGYRRTLAVR